ncbi:DNA sulfur modification protein DndD, partial [Oleiphilus sp. HI0117]
MILKEVIVHNFRVFSGTHRFDLMPREDDNHKRPIILFGGLNGSGKTSLLTAVRLGLYGKQAVGKGITIKDYHEYLASSLHKTPESVVPITDARVELIFNYARQGIIEEFRVIRSWSIKGQTCRENILIHRNGVYLEEFNSEQCQAFLNELIPIGVSDLFFFDGEKIADLAEDESGKTLQTAVKKLLGLDIIERLRNDLSLYLRRENKLTLPEKIQADIDAHENEMIQVMAAKDEAKSDYERFKSELLDIQRQIDANNLAIDSQGGAWASSRRKEEQNQDRLIAQKRQLEKALLDEMSGAYPLSFAKKTLTDLLQKLKDSSEKRKKQDTALLISDRLESIKSMIRTRLSDNESREITDDVLNTGFSDLLQPSHEKIPEHLDLSDSEIARYE